MLGLGDTATVASVCKPWEHQLGDGSNASMCSITPRSIWYLPVRLLGRDIVSTDGRITSDLISIAVWGGLAWFLFMRGK